MPFELRTARLVLRSWRPQDEGPFAVMNADAEVMEFFPAALDPSQSDALVERFRLTERIHGFCPWAAERRDTGAFIGFVGLAPLPDDLPCSPGTEVGWRLARDGWGHGFATEGATAVLAHAFGEMGFDEIVSMTAARNVRSRRVMERVGMHCDPRDDFAHPRIADGDDLKPHVLYRLTVGDWAAARAAGG